MPKCRYGFTAKPDCPSCNGSGVFVSIAVGARPNTVSRAACKSCLEDAIHAGEIDGVIDGTHYVDGHPEGEVDDRGPEIEVEVELDEEDW